MHIDMCVCLLAVKTFYYFTIWNESVHVHVFPLWEHCHWGLHSLAAFTRLYFICKFCEICGTVDPRSGMCNYFRYFKLDINDRLYVWDTVMFDYCTFAARARAAAASTALPPSHLARPE